MRKIRMPSRVCLALMLAGLATAARADDVVDNGAFAQRLFAARSIDKKTFACFVRRYDAAHLKQHPRQTVDAMKLLLTAEKMPEDGEIHYAFSVGVSLRKQPDNLDAGGHCGHPVASTTKAGELEFDCSVECDGGGVAVALADGDKAVLVRVERLHLWSPKQDQDRTLEGGDDKLFRLYRVGIEQCTALVTDEEELAAMRRK